MEIGTGNIPMSFWRINTIDRRLDVNKDLKPQGRDDIGEKTEDANAPKLSVISLKKNPSTGHVIQIESNDILLDSYFAGKSYSGIMKVFREDNKTLYSKMSDQEILENILNQS